jgi:peptide-methionine (R)-S-oxide reductase
MSGKIVMSDEEWKKKLSDEEFYVTRQKGTERPFSGKYYYLDEEGIYKCICCGNPLFRSDTKFDAGCGWPSYYEPISKESVVYETDTTHGMKRTEVKCARCDAHLGHVFEDGPEPTGLRYCINSVSIDFENKNSEE